MAKVLIGCEESGVVRDAFIAAGHESLSCDFQPTRRPGPHYQGDVFDVIDFPWDMGLFYFPCTESSVSGAKHFAAKKMDGRFYAGQSLWLRGWKRSAHIKARCFEHPVSVISSLFRKPDQIVQPWQFGHYETKATCFWLDGLPPPGAGLPHGRGMPRGAGPAAGHAAGRSRPQDGPRPEPGTRPQRNIRRYRQRQGRPVGRPHSPGDCSVNTNIEHVEVLRRLRTILGVGEQMRAINAAIAALTPAAASAEGAEVPACPRCRKPLPMTRGAGRTLFAGVCEDCMEWKTPHRTAAPPPADAVRALVGKWREEADDVAGMGSKYQRGTIARERADIAVQVLRQHADDLEAALSAAPAGEDERVTFMDTLPAGSFVPFTPCAAPQPTRADQTDDELIEDMREVLAAEFNAQCCNASFPIAMTRRVIREAAARLAQPVGGEVEVMVDRMVAAYQRTPGWSCLNAEAQRNKARAYLTAALPPLETK